MIKKNILILILATFILYSCCDCDKSEKRKTVINGKIEWETWKSLANWNDNEADNYKPSENIVKILTQILENNSDINFIIFSGSWCNDSEIGVPKIFKLFNECNLEQNRIKLFGVDRNKMESTGTADKFNIEKVPTLVIMLGDNELARIVEYPQKSWDKDIYYKLQDFEY